MSKKVEKNEKNQAYSFTLKDIEILEKSFAYLPGKKNEDFDYDVSLKISVNTVKRQSVHVINVNVLLKQDKTKVTSLKVGFIFDIKELETFVVMHNDEATLPEPLLALLNTVVIGTTRGIMYSELRGTALDGIFFPVLDPGAFLKGNGPTE